MEDTKKGLETLYSGYFIKLLVFFGGSGIGVSDIFVSFSRILFILSNIYIIYLILFHNC